MQILVCIKSFLRSSPSVQSKLGGGIWNNEADQADPLPNIVMMLMGGGDEITHQGPDGLMRQTIRIYSRGKTDAEAAELAEAVRLQLHGARFSTSTISVQLCQRTNGTSDFNAEAKVQRQIDSYMVAWRYNA